RAVDFSARQMALADLDKDSTPEDLMLAWRNGRIKQAVLTRALRLRHAMPEVFAGGAYTPVPTRGLQGGHVLAFLRSNRTERALVVVPVRCASGMDRAGGLPAIAPTFWRDTAVLLPRACAGMQWTNVLSGARLACAADGSLRLADVLASLPVALLLPD